MIQAIILGIVFTLGASISGYIVHNIDENKILKLQQAISQANLDGQITLNKANEEVKKIEDDNYEKVIEIQKAHNESIEINAQLTDALHNARMQYNKSNARKAARLPSCRDTSIPAGPAKTIDDAERPDRLAETIDRDAKVADENTQYAISAYKWVMSIPKELRK